MFERIKSYFKFVMQRLWGGRVARPTLLLGTAIYIAFMIAVSWPSEMVHFVAPQLLWELYLAVGITVASGSVLGIGRLYVKRLHDMGMAGYWAFLALIAAPSVLYYISIEYSSWRWQSDNKFPTASWNEAVGYIVLAAIVIFSLFKGSDEDNAFGAKPEAISVPQNDPQIRWTAIAVAALGVPYFAYLGFFNDRVWVGRSDYVNMPDKWTEAPDRAFMHCWGFKGISAYGNDKKDRENTLVTFENGFTRDGYEDTVFALYIDEQGAIDIVSNGKRSISYKKDGFDVSLKNPNNIKFQKYGWDKSPSAKNFMVTASAYEPIDSLQNETVMSFIKDNDYRGYKVIFTKNLVRGSGGIAGPYVSGQVMIGNCIAQ